MDDEELKDIEKDMRPLHTSISNSIDLGMVVVKFDREITMMMFGTKGAKEFAEMILKAARKLEN